MAVSLVLAGSILAAAAAAAADPVPQVRTNHLCYLVGSPVKLSGSGFAAARPFVVSIDDVYFGQQRTDGTGAFTASLHPGGLGAGVAQSVDLLEANDGSATADAIFTVTRRAGARLVTRGGNPSKLRAPFEIWGFALNARPRPVYAHYVSPTGSVRRTILLGHTGGECGYLLTKKRRVFPFAPGTGTWTLQLDTRRRYAVRPRGPVARILIAVNGG